jgi:hypothetical protein
MNQKIVFTRQIVVAIALVFSAAAIVSCEKYIYDPPPPLNPDIQILFSTDIIPIFTGNNCTDCHNGSFKDPDLRPANAYSVLTTGTTYINKAVPESSELYAHLLTSPHNTRCTQTQRDKILLWIKQGAKDN